MKRICLHSICIAALCCAVQSCETSTIGSSSSGSWGSESTVVTTDSNILGTWDIVKYEALNAREEVIKTVTDLSVIKGTYWRFVMAGSGDIAMWWGAYTSPAVTTKFSYNGAARFFYYGDYGCADVESLTKTSFVFLSTDFFPAGWDEDSAISLVRVTCAKNDPA